jgi:hypothetical protein
MARTVVDHTAGEVILRARANTTLVVDDRGFLPTIVEPLVRTVGRVIDTSRKDSPVSSQTLRTLASATVVGGVLWIATAVMNVAQGTITNDGQRLVLETTGSYALFAVFAAALALTIPALVALHAHQRGADGRLGAAGVAVACAGVAGQFVVISAILVNGGDGPWFDIAAPVAILTWLVGSILLGVAVHRAKLMPGWVGAGLPIAMLLAIVFAELGSSVLTGAYLIAVGAGIARAARAGGGAQATVARA